MAGILLSFSMARWPCKPVFIGFNIMDFRENAEFRSGRFDRQRARSRCSTGNPESVVIRGRCSRASCSGQSDGICSAIFLFLLQKHSEELAPGTRRPGREPAGPIFSVRVWVTGGLSAFAKDAYIHGLL